MSQKTRHRKEKLISLAVAMFFICGLFPLQAFAAETNADTVIVAFDPDDGTPYQDFHKATVAVGGLVPKPEDPKREGYVFKGWYALLDEDGPVFWKFDTETIVKEGNITLWAAWEKGCIVAFDPDDGTQYPDFHKVTVSVGELVPKPEDPEREGYVFKGWYALLDEDGPVFWKFDTEAIVKEGNITLWAAWEKGCIVAFDPDDGTQYPDFHKVTVSVGELVPKPEDPEREGYVFKGWYALLDEDGPVFWKFDTETIVKEGNITLWAAWEEKGITDPGTTDPGTIDPGTTDPGTTDPGTTDPGTTDPGTTDPGGLPTGNGTSGGGDLDKAPKTGDTSLTAIFYGALALISLLSLGLCLLKRKKAG